MRDCMPFPRYHVFSPLRLLTFSLSCVLTLFSYDHSERQCVIILCRLVVFSPVKSTAPVAPRNVLFNKEGKCVLIDFGLAREKEADEEAKITHAELVPIRWYLFYLFIFYCSLSILCG